MTEACADLVVADASGRVSGAWCASLFAQFGATVYSVQPGPGFADGADGAATEYFLHGKRLVVNPGQLPHADVLISDGSVTQSGATPYVQLAITPHGLTGPRAGQPGGDLTAYAGSGWASINGTAEGEPLKGYGFQAAYQAGTMAFAASLCALLERDRTDTTQSVDLAETDVLCTTFAPALLRSQYHGQAVTRRRADDLVTSPIAVQDGYLSLPLISADHWRKAMGLLGLDALGESAELSSVAYRSQHPEAFEKPLRTALQSWSRQALFERLTELRALCGPVLSFDDLLESEHLAHRHFFGGPNRSICGRPFVTHNRPDSTPPRPRPRTRSDSRSGPLAGYRGISLTHAWAGSLATELLALQGADVIQVESASRLDIWRGVSDLQFAGRTDDHKPWNANPLYNSVNLHKRSICVELASEAGRALLHDLVGQADFVVENFNPAQSKRLGFNYDQLCRIQPELVMCSISGYGQTGPWSKLSAVGATIEPASGMSALFGYENGPPLNSGQMYPDAIAGLYGFAAVANGLYHRSRHGRGQYIDLSMQEATLSFLSDQFYSHVNRGDPSCARGNGHPLHAPHGMFPCRMTGEAAGWVAIAVETDVQWRSLCTVMGAPPWADPDLTQTARHAHQNQLNAKIAGWTQTRLRDDLADVLADAGVPAAKVLNGLEVAGDTQLRARGCVQTVVHPEGGAHPQAVSPFRFNDRPAEARPAPCLGQHTEPVLQEWLGWSKDDVDAARTQGAIGSV